MKRLKLAVLVVALFVSSIKVLASSFNRLNSDQSIILKELKFDKFNDTIIEVKLPKGKPYKVVKHSPGLNYTVTRKGNGNTIFFTRRGGNWRLPEMTIYQNSGFGIEQGKKKGVKSVSFPFEAYISATVGFRNDISRKVNDFKIIIYEEGIWQIDFI